MSYENKLMSTVVPSTSPYIWKSREPAEGLDKGNFYKIYQISTYK